MSDHALEDPVRRAHPQSTSVPWHEAAWRQFRLERKMFWRNPSAAFFNFLLPLLFLAPNSARNSSGSRKLKNAALGLRQNILRSSRYWRHAAWRHATRGRACGRADRTGSRTWSLTERRRPPSAPGTRPPGSAA